MKWVTATSLVTAESLPEDWDKSNQGAPQRKNKKMDSKVAKKLRIGEPRNEGKLLWAGSCPWHIKPGLFVGVMSST
jgi:hypothetical protein